MNIAAIMFTWHHQQSYFTKTGDSDCSKNRVSDCCLMSSEQFFSYMYIRARISYISRTGINQDC